MFLQGQPKGRRKISKEGEISYAVIPSFLSPEMQPRGSGAGARHRAVLTHNRDSTPHLVSPVKADYAGEKGRDGPKQNADLKQVRRVPEQTAQHGQRQHSALLFR